jgi:hypothetical protein
MSGTYQVEVVPHTDGFGTITLQVDDVPSDAVTTASVDGPPVTVSPSVAGQNASVGFNATVGQNVYIQIVANLPLSGSINARLTGPGGFSASWSNNNTSSPGAFVTGSLPATGFYKLELFPWSPGTIEVAVHSAPPDSIVPMAIDGGPVMTTLAPGQRAIFTFNGAAHQSVQIIGPSNWNLLTFSNQIRFENALYTSSNQLVTTLLGQQSLTLPVSDTYHLDVGVNTSAVPISVYASVSSH